MAKKLKLTLSHSSIDELKKELIQYKNDMQKKCDVFLLRLCEAGYTAARGVMAEHIFSGETISGLSVEDLGNNRFALCARSKAILFFEFGAGVKYSSQTHPKSEENGMGAGTYPGAGHWNDPKGWWYPTDDARLIRKYDASGQGWAHSYGNPPYMPMYKASREMISSIEKIAKEVFG